MHDMVASCLLCARRHDGTFCQGARGVLKWSPSLDPWPSRPACPSRSYSASRRLQALLTQGQEILAYATDFNSSRCTARNHGSDTRLTLPFCVPASCKHILQQSKLVHARSFEGSGANATSTAHPREPQSRTTAGRIVKFFARDQPCRQFGSNHDRQANPLMFSVGLLKIVVGYPFASHVNMLLRFAFGDVREMQSFPRSSVPPSPFSWHRTTSEDPWQLPSGETFD